MTTLSYDHYRYDSKLSIMLNEDERLRKWLSVLDPWYHDSVSFEINYGSVHALQTFHKEFPYYAMLP